MKKTLLIFGVSSFLGSNLLELLRKDFRIIGTYHKTPVFIPGITCLPCDVLKKDYVSSLVARFRPDLTLYAVGLHSLKECQEHPKQADALNSVGAVNCCVASERYGAKFVYFSSGFVLGGDDVFYSEGETPMPNTAYGSSLSSTEFYIQRSCLNYLIFRCCQLYGRSFSSDHGNWFEHLQTAFSKGEAFEVDDSVHTGFLDVTIMAEMLKRAIDLNVTNRLLHVSSSDVMTRYEFAKLYARIFKKEESLIRIGNGAFPGGRQKEDGAKQWYRLNTSNVEELLNESVPSIEESLLLTYKRLASKN